MTESLADSVAAVLAGNGGTMGAVADGLAMVGMGRTVEPQCVGFADCPCRRCRDTRLAATDAHGTDSPAHQSSYCGACRTAERERYRV